MAYRTNFLDLETHISIPSLSAKELAIFEQHDLDVNNFYLDYHHYSLLQNPFRKLPYYTIANIDGSKFRALPRKDAWKLDSRIDKKYQLGTALYSAEMSDFDKGHMTKREDVQWGESDEEAKNAALSTFYYTNAVPQLDKLNRGIWSKIESFILHSEAVEDQLKITLLTGPVLADDDPEFVTKVNNQTVKIPNLFWKIIYYKNPSGEIHRTAFIANQKNLLQERRIVKPPARGDIKKDVDLFMSFKDAETYQTEVSLIEKLTGMKFKEAKENYTDSRPSRLVMDQTEVRDQAKSIHIPTKIKNLIL